MHSLVLCHILSTKKSTIRMGVSEYITKGTVRNYFNGITRSGLAENGARRLGAECSTMHHVSMIL
jgi:hypothetical protein